MKTRVVLFKPTGKYYTEEEWEVPEGAIGPYDMKLSIDYRTIDGGPVLIPEDSHWGFPCLLIGDR